MARVECFEDLIAWQKARALTAVIYRGTQQSPLARDYGLSGQLQPASVSIMSNIAEGYERGSARDFHHFLTIAKASCAEARSMLVVAHDVGHISQEQFIDLSAHAHEVARLIGGLRAAVSRRAGRRAGS